MGMELRAPGPRAASRAEWAESRRAESGRAESGRAESGRPAARVVGTGHQLKDNTSGGAGGFPGGDDNGKCELTVVSGNFNAAGNKANGVAIGGASGSAFPTACQGKP